MKRLTCILALAASVAFAAEPDARLVLLGTAGGPTPKKSRSAPAQVLQIGDALYVVDCGEGVARQIVLAGLPLKHLRHVFITHHHSDHVAGLFALPLLAWTARLDHPVTFHGPPPLRKALKAGFRQFAFDIETRQADEGRARLADLVKVEEIRNDGIVLEDERVTVRAARVEHPPIRDAYAYRFDTSSVSVVISGDTAPSDNLIRLARGADILVHEVLLLSPEKTAEWLQLRLDHPLTQHVVRSHTSYAEVGKIAAAAGVRKLVLSHFVPAEGALDTEAVLGEIRKSFGGEVIFGEDLLEVR
jgi:ribonuclease BN (tRNA processing enzyme)